MSLPDLNDFRLFAYVVDEGGFAAAGRKLGLPRSHVSRRIAGLEERLGVRLVQRSTRSFAVTEIGRAFHRQCQAMLAEAEAASTLIQSQHAEPQGLLRIACPSSLIQFQVGAMLTRFMHDCPKVDLQLESTNRRVDVLREGFDLAIRVRFPPLEDSDLIVRRFGSDGQHLVSAPALLAHDAAQNGPLTLPHEAARLPSLGWNPDSAHHAWELEHPDGPRVRVPYVPRLLTQDMTALSQAVLAGVGIAQLPHMVAGRWLASGEMVEVLPGWRPRSGIIHAVFPTRRGLLSSVRQLIDHLATEYASLERDITPPSGRNPP